MEKPDLPRRRKMTEEKIRETIEAQRIFFESGETLPPENRLNLLVKLKEIIVRRNDDIEKALLRDLGKSPFESYMCETGMVLSEINYMLGHTKSLAKPKRVKTPLVQFLSKSYTLACPYGVVLIMSPWNYPFMLTFDPLADAVAAGNTVILKPSAYSPAVSELIEEIAAELDPSGLWVATVTGGREENKSLLRQKFDYIFFTGSVAVGKEVMRGAAENLTPITLELGGKSPCIVLKDADIPVAARRIVFGKFLNCGQTCVAPDYVLCDSSVRPSLVTVLKEEIKKQYGNALDGDSYGKIVNEKHFSRILGLIDKQKTVCGGGSIPEKLKIEPTVMINCTFDDKVMQEEIFGPVLPVIDFDDEDELIGRLKKLPHPLALYVFTENKKSARKFITRIGFGGGCVNDTVVHLATTEMGFGGMGNSGMGAYHGKTGFLTFSHLKSVVDKSTRIDLPMRYAPYTEKNLAVVRKFMK